MAIGSMIMVPFDIRFRGLIERLAVHQRMFEGELNLIDQKMLVNHYKRFELTFQSYVRRREKARQKEKKISERKKKYKELQRRRTAARRIEQQKELFSKLQSTTFIAD
jgi:hypothetical protein